MDFFGSIKRGLGLSASVEPAEQVPVKGASFRERVVPTASEEGSLTVAAVFRAAELRSNTMAALRMRYLVKDRAKNYLKEDELPQGRSINYVVGVRPNTRMNAFQFWKHVEMMRMFHGHVYILPVWADNGSLEALIPCDGSWDRHTNRYCLTEPTFGINGKWVDADDVVVLRGVVTRQHPEGESIIRYAVRTMSVSATSEALALESAAKGGRQKLILQSKGGADSLVTPNPEQMHQQAQRLQESLRNDDVVYDDSGSSITPYNMSMVDMQLLEGRKFSVSDIARFFGVPRSLLMDDTNSNYKSAENASIEFLLRTLQPLIREAEDEFDCKLLTRSEYCMHRFRFDTSSLMSLDVATKVTWNKSRLETGVASVNELRAEMNMPSVADGDTHFVSANVLSLGAMKEKELPNTDTTNLSKQEI